MSLHKRHAVKHNKASPVTISIALEDMRLVKKAIGSRPLCRLHFTSLHFEIRNNLMVHCRITTAAFFVVN